MRGKNHGLLIAGGGVAGSIAALAMARYRPGVPMVLVGEDGGFGGEQTLILLDDELSEEERALLEPLIERTWEGLYVALPERSRKLKLRCYAVSPSRIDAAVRQALRPEQVRTDARIVAVRDTNLLLQGGDQLNGDGALDARSWAQQTTLELGWRKSLGRTWRFEAPHRVDLPVLFDTTLERGEGGGWFACIPFDDWTLLVERVELERSAELDEAAAAAKLDTYVARRGWGVGELLGEERGTVPVALGGDFGAYWRIGGARVAKLGARGGFFHPVTGSPLPDALGAALLLTRQRDFSGAALHNLFEEAAAALWKKRELQRSFNRGGWKALEGLYGLEAALIGRFFAGDLGLFDRRKIMAAAGG